MKCCSSLTSFLRKLTPILLMAVMGLASRGEDRFAITVSQVAQALCAGGMQVAAEQVSLPARVVASEADPALDIVAVERSRVRLACHVAGQCLPFYAMVSGVALGSLRHSEYTMRAGAHATLMIDDARAHIQVKVISLENGMAGKRIRVSSLDHKQTYFGEVVSASLLKGSF